MLDKKGFTYISVLLIFLLMAGTTGTLFFGIKNLKEQEKIIDKKIEVFNNSQRLSEEGIYQSESFRNIYKDQVLYVISKEKNDNLIEIKVSAFEDGLLIDEVSKYKYLNPEVLDENIE